MGTEKEGASGDQEEGNQENREPEGEGRGTRRSTTKALRHKEFYHRVPEGTEKKRKRQGKKRLPGYQELIADYADFAD